MEQKSMNSFTPKFQSKYMCPGMHQMIDVIIAPDSDEDFQYSVPEFYSSAPNIINVDPYGEVTAIVPGSARVFIKVEDVESFVDFEVLPRLQDLTISKTMVSLYIGKSTPIAVSLYPENAFDPSYEWISSDPHVAVVELGQDGTWNVVGKGYGDCTITCRSRDGGLESRCSVHVQSAMRSNKRSHVYLNYTYILAIIAVILYFIASIEWVNLAAGAAVILGVVAMASNKNDIKKILLIFAGIALFYGIIYFGPTIMSRI